MQIVIVRTCDTSKGRIVCEVPGGTKDSEPLEFDAFEAEQLLAKGHARLPPHRPPQVEPQPVPAPVEPPAAPALASESTEA